MKVSKLLRRLLSVVFTLGMVMAFLPGAAITAHAEDGPLVGKVIKNGESFTFDTLANLQIKDGSCFYFMPSQSLELASDPSYDETNNMWVFRFNGTPLLNTIEIKGDKTKKPDGIQFISGEGSYDNPYILGLYFEPEPGPLVGTIIKNGESLTLTSDGLTCFLVDKTNIVYVDSGSTITLNSDNLYFDDSGRWVYLIDSENTHFLIFVEGDPAKKPDGIQFVSGSGESESDPYKLGLYFEPEPTPTPPAPTPTPTTASDEKDEPAPKPEPVQDQTLLTGYIVNGKDAAGNDTYANFSQENVWKVVKISSDANSVTYDITPQWETYGSVRIGIPAPGFADGPVLVDHYKNGKLIATYSGWVTSEWCEFDNPDGFSRFVIRKQGTTTQTPRRGYVPDTGVR